MNLSEQVFTQAMMLAGALEHAQEALLRTLCSATAAALAARLRDGLKPEDCKADFVAAASLYALATLNEVADDSRIEQFTAGDVTIRSGGNDAASSCLRHQAEWIIMPYLKDAFAFRGV